MAIFSKETNHLFEKYKRFMYEGMAKMPQDEFLKNLSEHYNYISNFEELSFNDKIQFFYWNDIYKCIEVIFDRYQNEDLTFSVELDVIDKEVAGIFTPLVMGDIFYFSRELRGYNSITEPRKTPCTIVADLKGEFNGHEYNMIFDMLNGIEIMDEVTALDQLKGSILDSIAISEDLLKKHEVNKETFMKKLNRLTEDKAKEVLSEVEHFWATVDEEPLLVAINEEHLDKVKEMREKGLTLKQMEEEIMLELVDLNLELGSPNYSREAVEFNERILNYLRVQNIVGLMSEE